MTIKRRPKRRLLSIADGHLAKSAVPALGGAAAATFTVTGRAERLLIEAHGAAGPWSARVIAPGAHAVSAEPGAARLEITL